MKWWGQDPDPGLDFNRGYYFRDIPLVSHLSPLCLEAGQLVTFWSPFPRLPRRPCEESTLPLPGPFQAPGFLFLFLHPPPSFHFLPLLTDTLLFPPKNVYCRQAVEYGEVRELGV